MIRTTLPIYRNAIDFDALFEKYPLPDIYEATVYKWSADRIRAFQNDRFMEVVARAWTNPFYRQLWGRSGIEPGDIRSIDDIVKLPTFSTEDVKEDQLRHPPYGSLYANYRDYLGKQPLKVQTSGGTTGKARPTLYGPVEWEMIGLTQARGLYLNGARPGDVLQITSTNAMPNLGWCLYKACHDFLGIMPVTTGAGTVTPSRRQIELAFEFGTNIWVSFPEYLVKLANTARTELGRDVRDLNTKFIGSFLGPDTDNALRRELEDLWGCPVYDYHGEHTMGLTATECRHQNGLHILEDCTYFEILDRDTGATLPQGDVGDIAATVLFRELPPLIRFNLRDLGRIVSSERCECGSWFRRMDKFLGRSDDMVKIRGTNIYPMACLGAVKSDPRTTGEWFCVVQRSTDAGVARDDLLVKVEVRREVRATEGLKEHLEHRLHNDLGLRVAVELVDEDSLSELANIGREGKARRLLDLRARAP